MLKTLLLFVGLVLIYSAFLTKTYYWDGVLFSLYIEKVYNAELPHSILFHPNHLLYSGFGYLLYSFARALSLHLRAITLLQFANVLASAGTTAIVFAFTRKLCKSNWIAAVCSFLLAFGATWWKFSTDADSYILPVLLLMMAINFSLSEKPSLLFAGVCHSFAMLFHELAVFAYVPLLVSILLEDKPRVIRIRQVFTYVLGTAGSIALVYWLAYVFAGRDSGRTFLGWVTSFSAESQMTHSWRQIFIGYPASYLKLLAGGKLSLVRDYISLPVIAALACSGAALVAGIWLMRRPKRGASIVTNRQTKVVLWAWILPYFIFLAWWEPGSAFYKLFIWPPIVLLLGCSIAERSFWFSRTNALIAFSATLAAWNFGAFIFPHSHSSADPVLALAETINQELPKNATVYYKVLSPDDWYLQYFAPGRRWLQLSGDIKSLSNTDAGLVCFETTALESTNIQLHLGRNWQVFSSKHHVQFACR